MTDLDVVIVTHNSSAHLGAALDALPPELDVFVVDNASSDESVDVARAHGATVVVGATNAGFAAACNRGAALGGAKLILFLNPDAVIHSASVAQMVSCFDDPEVGVAAPRISYPDGSRQRVVWPFPTARAAWGEALGLHRGRDDFHAPGFVIGACFLVRREAFEAVNGFDERFWLYGEEADLCKRIGALGWSIESVVNAEATHVGGADSDGSSAGARVVRAHFMRGGELFVAKHEGRKGLVSYRMANLTGSVLRGGLGVGARSAEHRGRAGYLARALVSSPSSVGFASPATSAVGKGLVVCSLEAWDEVWRRNQFFVRELLAQDPDLRVLFVEPAFDVAHEKRQGSARTHQRGLRPVGEDGRVFRFEPVKWLPRKAGPMADKWRDRQVLDAARELGFVAPRLWVNDPSYATLADAVDWPAVYDITDDWSLVERGAVQARENEARLFARCEAITVCSQALADSRQAERADIVVIPNAVDSEFLATAQPRPVDLPDRPCVLYMGTLHAERIDVPLVAELAETLGDVAVVLVGPDVLDDASRARLDEAGVLRLGARPYRQVPGYLQHANVLIVPHVVSAFTESLDPIKFYECLAVGTPTVATPVAGFRDQAGSIRVADRSTFADAVREAIDNPPPFADQTVPSWGDRAQAFARVLEDMAVAHVDPSATRKKQRVVFFDHCAQLSGGELAMARLVPALAPYVDAHVVLAEHGPLEEVLSERGVLYDVLVMDDELTHTNRFDAAASGLRVHTVLATGRAVWMLRQRLRSLQPDLLHTNSLKAALLGGVAGRLAGVPVVWHVRDRMAEDYLPMSAIRLVKFAARILPTAIIANSESTKAALGIRHAHVVHSCVESRDDIYDARASAHGSDGPLCVVMVGRLAPWKGQDVFLRAFAQAFANGDESAVIAGGDQFGEDAFAELLPRLAAELGIASQVTFAGHVDDVDDVLIDADVLVHASTVAEPFGQVVVEGMAAGLAVIASDAGGPAEVIEDRVDGLLVAPNNANALADALRELSSDRELRFRLGLAGRDRARDFLPEQIALAIVAIYHDLSLREPIR